MQDFRNLEAWKRAHELVLRVYEESRSLPRDETFGLTMQLRHGATSIATGITAGCGRAVTTEAVADFRKAADHCSELEYYIQLAKDMALWPPTLCGELIASTVDIRDRIFGLSGGF